MPVISASVVGLVFVILGTRLSVGSIKRMPIFCRAIRGLRF